MAIEIVPITDLQGCADLQAVHHTIWSNNGDEIIPTHVLITWATSECVLLGAYDRSRREYHGMVGFALGWYGISYHTSAMLKYCSHIVGVLPEYQGRDIGLQLKLAQRAQLLAHGKTNLMTWTYDPLATVNGSFNIHRLGAVCATYKRDVYGEMTDALNAGAPSDRFQVDWWMDSERVADRVAQRYPVWASEQMRYPVVVQANRPHIEQLPEWDGAPVAVPLPEQLALLRTHDKQRLLEWRMMQRELFESAFYAGYQVVDCVAIAHRGWHYVMQPRVE
jgi:predicted GNAT superfamily acetyltransferase